MSLQQQRISALCEDLKLPAVSAEWTALAQRAADTHASFADFLSSLLDAHFAHAGRRFHAMPVAQFTACRSASEAGRSCLRDSVAGLVSRPPRPWGCSYVFASIRL